MASRVTARARAERKLKSTDFPQLPAAPDDYPTFPDKSTWPVVFPELPPSAGRRPEPAAAAHFEGGRAADPGRTDCPIMSPS